MLLDFWTPGLLGGCPVLNRPIGRALLVYAMPHRFAIGDNVQFHPAARRTIDPASGTYVVTKRLPGPGGKFHYRIKHPAEPHERIVWESELSVA
jgi:hypothetical protein